MRCGGPLAAQPVARGFACANINPVAGDTFLLLRLAPLTHAACSLSPPLQLGRDIRQGRRPEVPPPAELPGPGTASWVGLAAYCALMRECWEQLPGDRPSMDAVVARLQALAEQADA